MGTPILALALVPAFAVIVLVTMVLARGRHTRRREWQRKEARPDVLRQGHLVMSEQWLKGHTPPLRGRTDQVYRVPDGRLCPVETKSRSRVYFSDVVQTSAYAAMLRDNGHQTTEYGFIRCAPPGKAVRYRAVQLITTEQLQRIYERRQALLKGATPHIAEHQGLCRTCEYYKECVGRR